MIPRCRHDPPSPPGYCWLCDRNRDEPPRVGPCLSLGGSTDTFRDCPTCSGHVRLKEFACGKGLGIQGKAVPTKDCGPRCPGYFAKPPPEPQGEDMEWAVGVTTVPSRRELLGRTLASLALGGFVRPRLFLDGGTPGQAAEWLDSFAGRVDGITSWHPPVFVAPAWYLALTELYVRHPNGRRFAVFQDDVVTVRNLKGYLDQCRYPEGGYWNLITYPDNDREWHEKHGGRPGWFRSNQKGHGAQGLAFDAEACRKLLFSEYMVRRFCDATVSNGNFGNLPRGYRSLDGGVVTALYNAGISEFCHGPSLLFHAGEESSFGNRPQPPTPGFPGEGCDALSFLGGKTVAAVG